MSAAMTLTDFLLARVAEDEDVATSIALMVIEPGRRMVSDCQAKRRIIRGAQVRRPSGQFSVDPALVWVLEALALPYADHPDYREEWRP